VLFAGKAAPGYLTAKRIIKLINAVAEKVNHESQIGELLKVVFLPNYNVSLAQIIIPAAEISQHISTAGMEASGTSNMKFTMNGGIIIGTLDGANVEIIEEVGEENTFIFGARVEEVEDLRKKMYETSPEDYLPSELKEVIDAITSGMFGSKDELTQLVNTIRNRNDYYLVGADFRSYLDA
jgi:starch phosphorylase